jgi:pimeloyl-ACP methyl ester carboxylesterase
VVDSRNQTVPRRQSSPVRLSRQSGCVSFTVRGGYTLLLLLGILLLGGNIARTTLRDRYPPPGQMVDIGGYRLHLHCQGEGSPTVLMEAAVGSPGLAWALVQPEVARVTQTCVYDRAGLGWSEPGPRPRTAEVFVDELHRLLTNAGISGPYVLVGYSSGGWKIRLYAHHYPEETAGMVLVDSAHEEQFERIGAKPSPVVQRAFALLPLMVRSGIPALAPSLVPVSGRSQLPPDTVAMYQTIVAADPLFAETAYAEIAALDTSLAQVRAASITSLGDIPLVVLTHGRLDAVPGLTSTAESQQAAEQLWQALQHELVALSPSGKLVVAEESGHDILFEQPDLVVKAILEVVTASRDVPLQAHKHTLRPER